MNNSVSSTTYLGDYRAPTHLINSIDLYFSIMDEYVSVFSSMAVQANDSDLTDLFLNGSDLELISVKVDGEAVPQNKYRVDSIGLTIFDAPENFLLAKSLMPRSRPSRKAERWVPPSEVN